MASFSEPDKKANANRGKVDPTSPHHFVSKAPVVVQKPSKEMTQNMVALDPFRKVPVDVLSLIFIEAALMSWLAPLQLGAVCSRWRETLLCTPRAWACLQITPSSQNIKHQLLDLWFSRCGALKVHVSLGPHASRVAIDIVCRHEKNIQCLSFFKNSNILQGSFTQLEELRLGQNTLDFKNWSYADANELKEKEILEDDCSVLDVKRFPKLMALHLHSPSTGAMAAIARQSSFPPLHKLHIMVSDRYWSQIVECCAETLVVLAIERPSNISLDMISANKTHASITLPMLQNLSYVNRSRGPYDHAPDLPLLKTPALITYHETNGHQISPYHQDVASVTSIFLQNVKNVDWAQFPSLTSLELLDGPTEIKRKLSQLEIGAHLCTKLAFVNCVPLYGALGWAATVRLSMWKRSITTGTPIALEINTNGRAAYSTCFTFCHCDAEDEIQTDLYWEKTLPPTDFPDEDEDEEERMYRDDDDDEFYGEYEECPGCGGACLH